MIERSSTTRPAYPVCGSEAGHEVVDLSDKDSNRLAWATNGAIKPGIARELKKILVPSDISERSRKALLPAMQFARRSNAQIILLQVLPARYAPSWKHDSTTGKWLVHNWLRKNVEKSLTRLAQDIIAAGIPVEIDVRYGDAARQIAYVAGERNVDLIVMATHGYHGLMRAILGSVADDVTKLAPCQVFVVGAQEPGTDSGQTADLNNQRFSKVQAGATRI